MGVVVCTIHYKDTEKRDLVMPDHIPIHLLVNSIATSLGMPVGEKIFYELSMLENEAFHRIPSSRSLQQAFVLNGSELILSLEKGEQDHPACLVTKNDIRFRLRENTIIGRLTSEHHVDIDISDLDINHVVSRRHAVITQIMQNYFIKDVNSRNGTFINESRVPGGQSITLHSGDVICFGSLAKGVKLIFKIEV